MSPGYGKGASKGLADLLGQLQSEITAQHQLQAIAGVLLPGNQPTSQQAAPAPETAQTLAQIKAELKQMSGTSPTEDKTPFAAELAALQAQVAEAAK